MANLIDLSWTIINDLPVHPYDDPVKLYQDKLLERDGYHNSRLETGMHAGTRIDIPRHLLNSDTTIDEVPLDHFIGNGCILDVRNQTIIGMKKEYTEVVQKNDIVLLYTGFDQYFGTERYFKNHPVMDKELADFFIEQRIKMIGMDLPAPDHYPFEIHRMLLEQGVLILENLTRLEKLNQAGAFEVIALPLKIKAEAAPARVVAWMLARHLMSLNKVDQRLRKPDHQGYEVENDRDQKN